MVTAYKQTVFGPLWYLIEPCLPPLLFTLFLIMADISTGTIVLFNLAGYGLELFHGLFRYLKYLFC
jgi:lipopolysaccharide transport system permease protein